MKWFIEREENLDESNKILNDFSKNISMNDQRLFVRGSTATEKRMIQRFTITRFSFFAD